MTVLIAGGGIAGLSCALTCHQVGLPFKVFEASPKIAALGVGINLQPNAVRELFDLGLEKKLSQIGVETQEYGFFTKYGLKIWVEPRGKLAGYKWPQYSIHRGELQVMLYRTLIERAGSDCIESGWRATGFQNHPEGVSLHLESRDGKEKRTEKGTILVGADGIHSEIRKQFFPEEGPPVWQGAVLWRATSKAKPFRTEASMALAGHASQRIVAYPISKPDPKTGLVTMNWIAELKVDPSKGWAKEDYNRIANVNDFAPKFKDWNFDWLNVPELIDGAEKVFEFPMVDRDPVEKWTEGAVTLIGDAAHAMYPVGSNGASQAIVDARKLVKHLLEDGVTPKALNAYQAEVLPVANKLVLANRGSGPDAVMQMVEDLCGGKFHKVEDVIPLEKLAAHAAKYKTIAGFSIDELNALPPTIPQAAVI